MFDHINSWKVFWITVFVAAIGLVIFKQSDGWFFEILGVVIVHASISYNQHINPVF